MNSVNQSVKCHGFRFNLIDDKGKILLEYMHVITLLATFVLSSLIVSKVSLVRIVTDAVLTLSITL
jgi:hypothetical protein